MTSKEKGIIGEDYTAMMMEKKGYEIIDRNYHSRYGEIDIIAVRGEYIIFTEVKARDDDAMIAPLDAVGKAKQEKLRKTAEIFLRENPKYDVLQPRFDVAALTIDDEGLISERKYIINAF